jgi:hypothetical protein
MTHLTEAFLQAGGPIETALALSLLALLAHLGAFLLAMPRAAAAGRILLGASAVAGGYGLLERGVHLGRLPFLGPLELAAASACLLCALALASEGTSRLPGALASLLTLGALLGGLFLQGPLPPPDPASWQEPLQGLLASFAAAAFSAAWALALAALLRAPRGAASFGPPPEDPVTPFLRWARAGFLAQAAALAATLPGALDRSWPQGGEAWLLLAGLGWTAVLHLHHVKAFRGRGAFRAAAAWPLLLLLLLRP